jgi:hypothetical protein
VTFGSVNVERAMDCGTRSQARHDPVGVFEYACHEGNYGLEHMLKVSPMLDKPGGK